MRWQIVDDLPNQGSEGESEILLAATLVAAGDDVAAVRIPGELELDKDEEESFDLPFELLVKVKLHSTGPKTRLDFEFVPLAGDAAMLQDAARDIISELEQSLRMKLSLLLQIYGIASRQAALVRGIISGISALPGGGFVDPANVAPLSPEPLSPGPLSPEPFSFPGPLSSPGLLSSPAQLPSEPLPASEPLPYPGLLPPPAQLSAAAPSGPGPVVHGEPPKPGDSSKCPGCGQPVNDIFSFCLYCGYTIKQ
jgi:hypothetical protein